MIKPSINIDHQTNKIKFILETDSQTIYRNEEIFNLFKKVSDSNTPIDECLSYMSMMFAKIMAIEGVE